MIEKMKRPGVKKSGWTSDGEKEEISGCIEEIEEILGEIPRGHRGGLWAILSAYLHSLGADIGTPLKATREELETADTLCCDLSSVLLRIMKNPSCIESLNKTGVDYRDTMADINPMLKHLSGCCYAAARELPESGRWNQVIPARDLVRALSEFYQEYTGRPAREDITHDRSADPENKYSGPFFDLISTVNDYLNFKNFQNENASLGKFIYDALPK